MYKLQLTSQLSNNNDTGHLFSTMCQCHQSTLQKKLHYQYLFSINYCITISIWSKKCNNTNSNHKTVNMVILVLENQAKPLLCNFYSFVHTFHSSTVYKNYNNSLTHPASAHIFCTTKQWINSITINTAGQKVAEGLDIQIMYNTTMQLCGGMLGPI